MLYNLLMDDNIKNVYKSDFHSLSYCLMPVLIMDLLVQDWFRLPKILQWHATMQCMSTEKQQIFCKDMLGS